MSTTRCNFLDGKLTQAGTFLMREKCIRFRTHSSIRRSQRRGLDDRWARLYGFVLFNPW